MRNDENDLLDKKYLLFYSRPRTKSMQIFTPIHSVRNNKHPNFRICNY